MREAKLGEKDQPVADIATMRQRLDESLSRERFQLFLFGGFALLALALASVGVYGVVSYAVRLRLHEIGIRMALGARPGDVRRMILRRGLLMGAAGTALGSVLALGMTRFMSTLLFGVGATDALTFAGAAAVLMAIIATSSLVPSWRAARTDPLRVLREE